MAFIRIDPEVAGKLPQRAERGQLPGVEVGDDRIAGAVENEQGRQRLDAAVRVGQSAAPNHDSHEVLFQSGGMPVRPRMYSSTSRTAIAHMP